MKRFKFIGVILLINMLSVCHVCAQETDIFEGIWLGDLKVNQDVSLRIAFEIKADGKTYSATLNSIDQSAYGIPVETITIKDRSLMLNAASLNCSYEGYLLVDGLMKGTFKQGGASLELNLHKVDRMPGKKVLRPQEPKKPYPYVEENVKYENKEAGVSLAGTLTKPSKKGVFPAVVLISGSGANDRDELVFGHRVFLVLADYLTRQGFAVLRFDDRGVGESTGDFSKATVFDMADDVIAAVEYLKGRSDIKKSQIGLIGHSLGGEIAPIAASKSSDINYIVLMAGAGMSLEETIYLQCDAIYSSMGISKKAIDLNERINRGVFDIVRNTDNLELAKKKIDKCISGFNKEIETLSVEEQRSLSIKAPLDSKLYYQFLSPVMRVDLFVDPSLFLSKVTCPVLAINGSKDLQVLPQNLDLIETAVKSGGNNNVTIKLFKDKNHLFQTCKTGAVSEYKKIEETMCPSVQKYLSGWLNRIIGE